MARKHNATEVANKQKINPQAVAKAKEMADSIFTALAKVAGAAFFIATSYGYIAGWLKTHQGHSDLSTAGAILVVSTALYLYTRKR